MSRVLASLSTAAFVALAAVPISASAGCSGCYVPRPQPCVTCYQQQVIPPQYQTYNETVMVSPGRRIAHRVPARYDRDGAADQHGFAGERAVRGIPPQYATVQRTQMVAPARTVWCRCAPAAAIAAGSSIRPHPDGAILRTATLRWRLRKRSVASRVRAAAARASDAAGRTSRRRCRRRRRRDWPRTPATTARACAIASGAGVNTSLMTATCAGWIAILAVKPSRRASSLPRASPSMLRKSA